uniref:Two-component system, OmpR family, response regulator ResD n=1 Tax=Tetraselmis sp. GSL018 TaxID=582737 RepID=A0A061S2V4_9CHLO
MTFEACSPLPTRTSRVLYGFTQCFALATWKLVSGANSSSLFIIFQAFSSVALTCVLDRLGTSTICRDIRLQVQSLLCLNVSFVCLLLAVSSGCQTSGFSGLLIILWQIKDLENPTALSKSTFYRSTSAGRLKHATSSLRNGKTGQYLCSPTRSRDSASPSRGFRRLIQRNNSPTKELLDEAAKQNLVNLSHWYDRNSGRRGSSFRLFGGKDKEVEVLCVDDNAVDRAILRKLLKKHELKATCETSGESALLGLSKRFERGEDFPSLIVMDLFMSGMSGIETARKIRELYPLSAMPIIFLSSEEDPASIGQALDAGGNDYIAKPFTEDELIARIRVQVHMLEFWESKMRLARDSKLLKEILPSSVIHRLHLGENLIADSLPDVTVLFSDIVGFTDLAASVPTTDVVQMLDSLFRTFDDLTERHGVYKVETIGDAYMVVAGLDEGGRADNAERALSMARDMIAAAGSMLRPDRAALEIRVGLHAGPAYAGVVGTKRPRFCLFGDTINVASRMESTSFPQCIHVSSATRDRYASRDTPAGSPVEFVDLGLRKIKGKGHMRTWLAKEGAWERALSVAALGGR